MARLHLFGHPALEAAASRRPLGLPPKGVATIALIAANAARPLSRDWLAQMIWPDSEISEARANLRRQLHLAQKILGEEALVLTRQTVQWNPSGCNADVVSFDALYGRDPAAAVEEYTGDLCAGIAEECLEQERVRYRSRYESLLRTLLEEARAANDTVAARLCLERIIAFDPFEEQAVRELMGLRIESGDRAGAIRDYSALCRRLLSELGVEPQPETARLFAEIAADDFAPKTPNNLIPPTTTFVGREPELAKITAALGKSRIVTLVGPGGIGKSRLAVRSGFDLLSSYPDGIWLVELDNAKSEDDVWERIAEAAGVLVSDPRKSSALEYFRERDAVVVLDTCERVADAVCTVAREFAARTRVKVLATSRQRLDIADACEIHIPALDIPPPELLEGDSPLRYSASRLFVERAVLASPAFRIDATQIASLSALLQSVDGLPLAIELVASRANVLSVDGLRRRLAQAIRTARAKDARGRGGTLNATLSWSYDMLSGTQRETFTRLGVFQGSFSVEDAEHVCEGIPNAAEALFQLVDASLVSVVTSADEVRYRLLETTRSFAYERLAGTKQLERALLAHADCFAVKADALAAAPEQRFPAVVPQLVEAVPDYLKAFEDAALYGWGAIGVRLIEGLYRFAMRGHFTAQICSHAKALLENSTIDAGERARVARLAAILDDNHASVRLFEFAAAYYRERGDELRLCDALSGLAATHWRLGNYDECERLLFEARERAERTGDKRLALKTAARLATLATMGAPYERALEVVPDVVRQMQEIGEVREAAQQIKNLASAAFFSEKYDDAIRWAQQALEHTSATSERAMRVTLLTLCGAACQGAGDLAGAAAWHLRACELVPELGDCLDAAESLEDMAATLTELGDFATAARMAGFGHRVRLKVGAPIRADESSAHDRMVARLAHELGPSLQNHWEGHPADTAAALATLARDALARHQAARASAGQENEDTTSLS